MYRKDTVSMIEKREEEIETESVCRKGREIDRDSLSKLEGERGIV